MEQTAIEIYKTFGITGGIIIAVVVAIIKGYPQLLNIIQKRQDIKEKNICKTEKVLSELTVLITNEQSILENKIAVELQEINSKLDKSKIQSIKRSVTDFCNDIDNKERKSVEQCLLIQEDMDYYKIKHDENPKINGYTLQQIKKIEKYLEKRI